MNCREAREAMLVAEATELRGVGSTELAEHVAACDACRDLGRSLSADLVALEASVRRRPRRTTKVIVSTLPIAAVLVAGAALFHRSSRAAVEPTTAGVAQRTVSVQVAPGHQAAVFATKDTNVTVVWISTEGGL